MNADKDELGMICGGQIEVFVEPVKMFARVYQEE
jgi:xanthine/CO dehydrogenase XdhC/CoxF family maturation factor